MTDNLSEIAESRVSQSDALSLDNSPGAQLRRAREKTGLSCEALSSSLCMTVDTLERLERDEYERLPGAPYVRGYIRNACKELGIDPAPLLQAYSGYVAAEEESREILAHASRGSLMEERKRSYKGLALLPLLAVAGAFWWINDRGLTSPALTSFQSGSAAAQATAESEEFAVAANPATAAEAVEPALSESLAAEPPAVEQAPAQAFTGDTQDMDGEAAVAVSEPAVVAPESGAEAAETMSEAAGEQPSDSEPAADTSATAAAATDSLQLQFDEDAWIEVKDATGAVLLAKLKSAGSQVTLEGQPPFSLMLGNAVGTQVRYRGKLIDSAPLGGRSTRRLTVGE